ncbi:MAG TPA: Hsp20 family protein [Aliiroseovarius sp.]|nr:Hsp20 family protein [Aliiroseovarius sp.]
MTKMTFSAHPMLLGFEQLERMAEQAGKSGAGSYPPFNIEQVDENTYRITLAVAGFTDQDLAVTLENNKLLISGRQPREDKERTYLHRGIARRQFQKSFVLADGVEVTGATTQDGLLHIDLKRIEPEKRVRTVRIKRG